MRRARTRPLAILVAVALGLAACVPQQSPPRAAAPGVHTVPASIDATGGRDVTAALNAFVRSVPDGATIRLARNGHYRVEGTLLLEGRRNLTLDGNRATVFATTTGNATRAHVRIHDSSHIVVRDLRVRGVNAAAGTTREAYVPAREHQHGFDIRSSRVVALTNVDVRNTHGDLVYLGMLPGKGWSEHVVITKSHFEGAGRAGIALISVRHVLIDRNWIGQVPRSTFNFEPTATGAGTERVTIRNNDIGPGRLMFVAAGGKGPVHHVTVANNRLRGQNLQFLVHNGLHGHRDGWRVVGNHSDFVSGNPHASLMRFWRVNGLEIRDNHQRFQEGRDMVVAHIRNSCNLDVRNNVRPGSVGETRIEGSC